MKIFSAEYLNQLTQNAESSPRLREHANIHANYQDPCQRLFNAIEPASYIQPHRHTVAQGTELLIAVRGLMALITYDHHGQILRIVRFGSEKYGANIAAGLEIAAEVWHTVVVLAPGSVLLEIKAGPFDPAQAKIFASWAPAESTPEAATYLERMKIAVSESF